MADKIHVLLVEHDNEDHDNTINMLQYFSYKVTTVKLASTALSMLSEGKAQFDLLMANMNSPDSYGFQLLRDAVKMDLLVILISDQDDVITTRSALEQGAFLCIKKPVTMETTSYLWQHVLRQKAGRLKKRERFRDVIEQNMLQKEFREEEPSEGNDNVEENYKSKKKANSGSSQHDNVMFKKKVWTEWTEELHQKFMDAVIQLGEGRCYPKDILELMNVPGLTRMQVASHLQKCRNANWLPPRQRKSILANAETKPPKNKASRAKSVRFGSMPHEYMSNNSGFHLRIRECDHEKIHQEFTNIDPPMQTNMLGDNHDGSSDKEYHPQLLLGDGNNPFSLENVTLNTGQTYGMDEPFMYGVQSVTPSKNTSSNQRDIAEDACVFQSTYYMVQNFSALQQELGMDYNGNLQSLVLDLYPNQISTMTNATNQWGEDAPKSVDNEENEGQMREE